MSTILDRLVIWACCSALIVGSPVDTTIVVAMLAAVTTSALNGYSRSMRLRLASVGLYLAAAVVQPSFCLFLPVVYYDIYEHGSVWTILAAMAALASCFAGLPIGPAITVTCLIAVAWVLRRKLISIEHGQAELRKLRDSGQELTTQLTQKHKELLQKQDYEIRLATLNERGRIAREIHDHVGHLLSRSILQVAALIVTQEENDETLSTLSALRNTLSKAMDSIRSSVHDLHDESFDLRTRVQALVQDFSFCPIRLDYRIEREPHKEAAYCFIAIIKEGLSNIIRHSNATRVTLALLEHPALYQLVLQDNGTSFASGSGSGTTGEGLGLHSMEDRVAALGGQFLVEHHRGFRLFVSVPKGEQCSESASR